jgi:hypothetical protein
VTSNATAVLVGRGVLAAVNLIAFFSSERYRLTLIASAGDPALVANLFTEDVIFVVGAAQSGYRTAVALLELRQAYEAEVVNLGSLEAELREAGEDVETVARAMSSARRAIGEFYKNHTPDYLLKTMLRRNIEDYQDELGPTYEWLKTRGYTDEEIIKSAQRPGGDDIWCPRIAIEKILS